MFRIVVTSSDGHQCGVPVQVDDHPTECRPYAIRQVADSLVTDRDEIYEVLDRGTNAQLRAHLKRYTKDELKPLHLRPQASQPKPFFGP